MRSLNGDNAFRIGASFISTAREERNIRVKRAVNTKTRLNSHFVQAVTVMIKYGAITQKRVTD
jgi:hypothetical protein